MGSMDSMESKFDSNGAPCGRGPASRKEHPFPVVMVTRIALDSDEVIRGRRSLASSLAEKSRRTGERESVRVHSSCGGVGERGGFGASHYC